MAVFLGDLEESIGTSVRGASRKDASPGPSLPRSALASTQFLFGKLLSSCTSTYGGTRIDLTKQAFMVLQIFQRGKNKKSTRP